MFFLHAKNKNELKILRMALFLIYIFKYRVKKFPPKRLFFRQSVFFSSLFSFILTKKLPFSIVFFTIIADHFSKSNITGFIWYKFFFLTNIMKLAFFVFTNFKCFVCLKNFSHNFEEIFFYFKRFFISILETFIHLFNHFYASFSTNISISTDRSLKRISKLSLYETEIQNMVLESNRCSFSIEVIPIDECYLPSSALLWHKVLCT